jgi:hypothetical protein
MRSNQKWMLVGFLAAFAMSSIASIPRSGSSSSMALPQEISEIKLKRQQEITYDQDLKRLSQLQARYKENLPYKKRAALGKKVSKKPAGAKKPSRSAGQVNL